MKIAELLLIEVFALGMFGWFVLHALGKRRKRQFTERAIFVGGPLDGQEKKLRSLEPTYTEKVERGKYAVYLHNSYGVYAFDDYVKQP